LEGYDVSVNITVSDATGVDEVVFSYHNLTGWYNTSTLYVMEDDVYIGIVPSHPAGSLIHYKFYANDTLGYWGVSSEYNYTVATLVTTSTTQPPTTQPVTTTPVVSTTPVTTTAPQTSTPPQTSSPSETSTTTTSPTTIDGPDYLLLAIMLTLVLLLFIAGIFASRRR
jgi:hypothetical protein